MNKIYSVHFNRPDLLELQFFSFKSHLKNNFKFIVINNAKDLEMSKEIDKVANKLNCEIFYGNAKSGLAGEHHQQALNNCWKEKCIYDKDYIWIVDGDVFLVKDIDINNFLGNSEIACARQNRKPSYNYMTPCIVIFNMNKIPEPSLISWSGCLINNVALDTGGHTYYFLKKYKNIKNNSKDLKSSWHIKTENKNMHCLPDEVKHLYKEDYCIEFFGNEFIHYRASSNWDYKTNIHHDEKTNFIKKIVYGSVDGSVNIIDHNFQINNSEYFGWDIE
jgi:hypothetical protein